MPFRVSSMPSNVAASEEQLAAIEDRLNKSLSRRIEELQSRVQVLETADATRNGKLRLSQAARRFTSQGAPTEVELAEMSNRASSSQPPHWEHEATSAVLLDSMMQSAVFHESGEPEDAEVKSRFEIESKTVEHELSGSLWELCLLLGMKGVSRANSTLVGVSLVTNIVVQTTFCVVLYSRIVGDEYADAASFRHWRYMVGQHSEQVEHGTWTSMASRICHRDDSLALSTGQRNSLDNINNFFHVLPIFGVHFTTGGTLVTVACFVWCMVVIKEMWGALRFLQALWEIPKAARTMLQRDADGGDEPQLQFVSMSHTRFCFLAIVTAFRMAIAFALLLLGSLWLSETAELGEIVLNAVAMIFVLDIDEYLFDIGIAMPARVLYRSFKPLPRTTRLFLGIDAPPIINYLLCFVFVVWILNASTGGMMEAMDAARSELCDGNANFAVGVHPATGLLISTRTLNFTTEIPSNSYQEFWMGAVQELINMDPKAMSAATKSQYVDSRRLFETIMAESMEDRMRRAGVCEDLDPNSSAWGPVLHTLQFQMKLGKATSCQDFAGCCTDDAATLLRFSCPVTCGCRNPLSGLLLNGPSHGCPRDLCEDHEKYQEELAQIDCKNPSVDELMQLPGWRLFLQQAHRLQHKFRHRNITEDFEREGCDALLREGDGGDVNYHGMLCEQDDVGHRTLHSFCPVSCGCTSSRAFQVEASRCPSRCFNATRHA